MKISKSKQELARIISENGGWRKELEFAAQDRYDMGVDFYARQPRRDAGANFWHLPGRGYSEAKLRAGALVTNWHQTILSRTEYLHLYPAPNADGWIEWKGGECPVKMGTLIDVKYRDGHLQLGCRSESRCDTELYATTHWGNSGGAADIIAYRLHKPEVKPEFCESVARGIPEPGSIDWLCAKVTEENKHQHAWTNQPTIEQLAADYRNKIDYANSKRQEADEAKAAADAALVELERAGEALGLLIGIAKQATEPELVITDWRHLQKGDIVWWSGDHKHSSGEYQVHNIEEHYHTGSCAILLDVGGCCVQWIDHEEEEWRFIRRP